MFYIINIRIKIKSKISCSHKIFDFRKIIDRVVYVTQSNKIIRDHDRDRGAECDRDG